MSHEIASITVSDNDGDPNKSFRRFGCAYIAQVLSSPSAVEPEHVVEYGVNVTDGMVFPWNPFEQNFPCESSAEEAARQYLLENQDEQSAVIFELVIANDQIISDRTLNTIDREDLVDACVPQ